jgi:hypothetical protein
MLVKQFKFNEAKLLRIIRRADNLHAALMRAGDEHHDALDKYHVVKRQLDRGNPAKTTVERFAQLQAEVDRLREERDQLGEQWQSAKSVATHLENTAMREWRWKPEAQTLIPVGDSAHG